MKRILFYTDTHQCGGTEQQMYLLAKFLPRQEFSITLACSNNHNLNLWCSKFIDLGMSVVRLDVLHKHDPRHYFAFRTLMTQCDLAHLHLWNPASCRYALAACRDVPLVTTEHDPFRLSWIKSFIKIKLHNRVQKIIVASTYARDIVQKHYPALADRVTVIPHGIDIESWRAASELTDRDEFRKIHFSAKSRDTVVLCVAELHERKGQQTLIEAISQIRDAPTNIRLVFVGKGPNEEAIRRTSQRLKIDARFLGRREDVAKIMRAADIFVLPSQREAFGLVILEAGISEVPIIASDVGGIRELLHHEKTGVLVPAENSEALARAITDFINNSWDCRKYVTNMRNHVEADFDAKKMAEKTAALYNSII